jgi:hypothetical protein
LKLIFLQTTGKFFIFIMLGLACLSSCSVYKSDGRKNLESVGPTYYQNKVVATVAVVSPSVMSSYTNQHPEKIVYAFCEAQDSAHIAEVSTDSNCSFNLSCIEITDLADLAKLENERHRSLQLIDQRLLLSSDEHRIFQSDMICVTR